jgi:DNA-directed RNA polymerase subunit RPC12/RpoP
MDKGQALLDLRCTQCGGELHPDDGQRFLICPYCATSIYLDRSKVVFHWALKSNLDQQAAISTLKTWMAGQETAKDLDEKSLLHDIAYTFFPLWYFRTLRGEEERIYLQPAAATGTTELRRMTLPGGDFEKFDPDLMEEARPPTVPLDTALDWVRKETPNLRFLEIALVHVPVYRFTYGYKDRTYTALVEASTGRVLANIFPRRRKMPYFLTALFVATVFTCLSFFPLIGFLIFQEQGALYGALACAGLGIIMVPILIALATLVAATQ